MAEKYNGWTNYETWNVALWIDNDEGTYTYWRDQARDTLSTNDNNKDDATNDLRELLKDEIEDGNPLVNQNGMYSDILTAALSDVNWHEIAANWIEEVFEDVPAEEAAE